MPNQDIAINKTTVSIKSCKKYHKNIKTTITIIQQSPPTQSSYPIASLAVCNHLHVGISFHLMVADNFIFILSSLEEEQENDGAIEEVEEKENDVDDDEEDALEFN